VPSNSPKQPGDRISLANAFAEEIYLGQLKCALLLTKSGSIRFTAVELTHGGMARHLFWTSHTFNLFFCLTQFASKKLYTVTV